MDIPAVLWSSGDMRIARAFASGGWFLMVACSAPTRRAVVEEPRAVAANSPMSAPSDGGGASPTGSSARAVEAHGVQKDGSHDRSAAVLRAKHGGIVTAAKGGEGLLGVEVVVERDGAVRIYVIDESGAPIPPDEIRGDVVCERGPVRTAVTVAPNPLTGAVEGRCAALNSQVTIVAYEIRVRSVVHRWTLRVPPTGTAGMARDSH